MSSPIIYNTHGEDYFRAQYECEWVGPAPSYTVSMDPGVRSLDYSAGVRLTDDTYIFQDCTFHSCTSHHGADEAIPEKPVSRFELIDLDD